MALADYYLCNVCSAKCYYDADADYDGSGCIRAAICLDCAKTYLLSVERLDVREAREAVIEAARAWDSYYAERPANDVDLALTRALARLDALRGAKL